MHHFSTPWKKGCIENKSFMSIYKGNYLFMKDVVFLLLQKYYRQNEKLGAVFEVVL